jgi:hypothetical protein
VLRPLDEDTAAAWEAEAVDEDEGGACTRDADGLKESLEASRNWLKGCIVDVGGFRLQAQRC